MKTLIAFIRIIANLLSQNKHLKQAKKLDAEGKIKERDELVVPLVKDWAKFIVSVTGPQTQVTVIGEENIPKDGACVFVGNHQSYFDIPVLLGYVSKPKAFISKAEILKVPILSQWMKLMQCVFLVRNNPRQSIEAMNQAVENVKKGYSLVIFPEGHRAKDGVMQDFKAGSFKLAFRSNAPIVPFTLDGTYHLFEEKGLSSAKVVLTFHEPIATQNLTREEQGAIPQKVQDIVKSALSK